MGRCEKCEKCGRFFTGVGKFCTSCKTEIHKANKRALSSAIAPELQITLSDEYQHNHLQEAMDYALKEKGFVKADSGKLQWSLLPFEELKDVVRVLMLGAKKYTPDNWKKCNDVTRYKDALMRHVISYVSGDETDEESQLSHLAHAVCNCLFLMYFDNTKKEE